MVRTRESSTSTPSTPPRGERGWWRRLVGIFLVAFIVYGWLAYGLLPWLWKHYEHQPNLEPAPKTSVTAEGIPGDPLNVALAGTQTEVVRAMLAADWMPADPITFGTSVRIVKSTLLHRSYPTAPVSHLYLWGRRQDMAFEQQAGSSAARRHHVRFWKAEYFAADGRPFWLGCATFDRGVGLSHWTGKVTHHIDADLDQERDRLMSDLRQAGQLAQTFQVTGIGPTLWSRNGNGDRYFTDGELNVGVLVTNNLKRLEPPVELANPGNVTLKNKIWSWLRRLRVPDPMEKE